MNIDITLDQALARASITLRRKIEHSIELLRKAEKIAFNYDRENGYYLAFSGGKDSQALYHIAQLANVHFKGHMNVTSVDPPEVIRFVKQYYPEVELIKPDKSIYQHAVEKKILPTRIIRWCCAEYKETAGAGKVTLIGIRHAESSRRAKRNEVEISTHKFSGDLDGLDEYRKKLQEKKAKKKLKQQEVNITNADKEETLGCISGKESLLISPIIYWTERDVWEFLNDIVKVPHCSLYDEGWQRIGCIGCPMSSAKQKRIENKRYPHVKRNWIKAIKTIRNGDSIQPRIYLVEHPQGHNTSQKHQRITKNEGSYINHPDPLHWIRNTRINSSNHLTEELENEIAENIYDWWISGKSYKRWYAEKFQQIKIDFREN